MKVTTFFRFDRAGTRPCTHSAGDDRQPGGKVQLTVPGSPVVPEALCSSKQTLIESSEPTPSQKGSATTAPVLAGCNVYYRNALPSRQKKNPLVLADRKPVISPEQQGDQWFLHDDFGPEVKPDGTSIVTGGLLG